MTQESFEQLAQTLIASGETTTVYTVPDGSQTIIKHITIVNATISDAWVKLWTVGDADENLILPQVTIDAGGWADFDGTITLSEGETLSAEGETNEALSITVHGLEVG